MKKMFALFLTAAIALSLFGCAAVQAENTTPPETTQAPETTAPAETAKPQPSLEDRLAETGFESFGDGMYRYAGSDAAIELTCLGVTLTLPEEWLGSVEIIQDAENVYVTNRAIIDANIKLAQEQNPGPEKDEMLGWEDYMFRVFCKSKDAYFDGDPKEPEVEIYLGGN